MCGLDSLGSTKEKLLYIHCVRRGYDGTTVFERGKTSLNGPGGIEKKEQNRKKKGEKDERT